MSVVVDEVASGVRRRDALVRDLRMVAASVSAALLVAVFTAGVGGRLAMLLLARLNPRVHGIVSDDGFVMGRFDLGNTVEFVVTISWFVGVVSGLVYLAIRSLRFGPTWFRRASMAIGPAVVIGAMMVNQRGVDFVLLDPAWLPIALFVLLPGLHAAGTSRLADRWLDDPDGWWFRTRWGWLVGLLPLLPVAAILGPVVLAAAAVHAIRPRWTRGRSAVRLQNAARVGLAAVFGVALVDLVRDVVALT